MGSPVYTSGTGLSPRVRGNLPWMHQRLGIIEERLVTMEEKQRENATSSE